MARTEGLEKAQAEVELLKGELAILHAENRSLKVQLEEAKVAAANAISEHQSSVEMAALKQTVHDEAYEEAAEAFTCTTATTHLDWDLVYLEEHLVD